MRAAAPGRVVTVVDTTSDAATSLRSPTPPIFHPPAPPARPPRTGWLRRRSRAASAESVPEAPTIDFSRARRRRRRHPGRARRGEQGAAGRDQSARQRPPLLPESSPIEIIIGTDRAQAVGTIAIVDHGEGIPPQVRDQIFERFWRADTSRARETGGSGLGLAIVASIVAALEGSVSVEETPAAARRSSSRFRSRRFPARPSTSWPRRSRSIGSISEHDVLFCTSGRMPRVVRPALCGLR
ncbi:sensor histidine kinase [Microbacterium sp. NIBRBAC000506063]|uniref:sensor histidine kinase n=1 Tax=Microbacterium sp. NIBRBAC000506063 TaxID=2734618 RepID=UPI002948C07E|nr:sensor histidine kinase [Microbacterium sp. NIBRBAC000506063]